MMRKRMVFRLANIQQRPERFWLVMSPWESWTSKVLASRLSASGTRATLRIGLAETAFFAMRAAGSEAKAACALRVTLSGMAV